MSEAAFRSAKALGGIWVVQRRLRGQWAEAIVLDAGARGETQASRIADLLQSARREAIEEAAKVAEGAMCAHHLAATRDQQVVAKDIIGRLRALNNEGK